MIPEHFGRDLARGAVSPVQLLVDAADANTAKLASGYAGQIVNAYNQRNFGATHPPPVQAAMRMWYNPGLSSKKFYGPGIFRSGALHVSAAAGGSGHGQGGRAKNHSPGLCLQHLGARVSAGQNPGLMVVALSECLVMLGFLFTYFGLSFVGEPTPFLVATLLYAFCVASFGTMVGVNIPSQVAAMQVVALGGFLLVFLLSGLIFPVENIPIGLRWISNFIWGRYYIEVVRDALLQGGGWPAVWFKVLVIAVIGAIFYTLAWRGMRRMQVKA